MSSPSLNMTNCLLGDRRTPWVISAVIILLFAIANLPWQLDDYDQAKQAFTSFEMIKEGHWLYQHTPHQRVATKPPLTGWVSAGLFAVTRSWEIAWRLPSFLAAVALSLLLFQAARSAYGSIGGLIALGAFGFNLLSPRLATLVRTDMPLALVIFLIGVLIWQKIQRHQEWSSRDQIYIFALLTAAMLIKGPIVYAFLLPGIALFQWRSRRVGFRAVTCKIHGCPSSGSFNVCQCGWSGWWPWMASLAIFLLWVLGGVLFQPGFCHEVVMREFLGRFGEGIHRPQPLYFYLPHLLHKFAPWSVLMIGIAALDLASRRWRIRAAFREMSPETFWLLCWSIGGLIMMSLIPSKRVDRIYPVIPPLCLVLAAQISGRAGAPRRHAPAAQPYVVVGLALAILFTGGYTIFKVATGYRDHRDALAVFGRKVRQEAELRHWRYEVVFAKDEGLLLYLRKTHFVTRDQATAEWNHGRLDALVASTAKAPTLLRELRCAAVSPLKSDQRRKGQRISYALITR
jgi:4-amino-4-deoxy-L-arabinose transferase-like glycosyltransferase